MGDFLLSAWVAERGCYRARYVRAIDGVARCALFGTRAQALRLPESQALYTARWLAQRNQCVAVVPA